LSTGSDAINKVEEGKKLLGQGRRRFASIFLTPTGNEFPDDLSLPGTPHLVFDEVDKYVPDPLKVQVSCDGCPLLPGGFSSYFDPKK